ncbi:MAG: hypothetical protein JJD92_02785 [Frankiaceae bacterium]|nr:hypothetical protein [Frankiaceae bacterium]
MDEISSGPPTRQRMSRIRRVGAAAAVGVGLAVGAAGIAGAADNPSPSPSPGAGAQVAPQNGPQNGPPPGEGRRLGGGHGPRGDKGMGMGPGGALHGEFVVPDGNGGYRTVRTQRGDVTAVSSTSLTVKSEDGYTKTYVLTPSTVVVAGRDGIGTVKKGETVAVMATVSGGTATANHVRDLTTLQAERRKLGPRRGPPPGAPAPGGTPASPSSYDGDTQGA